MNTSEMLNLLATLGRPTLRRMSSGGWHADIEFPAPEGVTMKVASDFDHPTHESALIQLLARLGEISSVGRQVSDALKSVGGTVIDIRQIR